MASTRQKADCPEGLFCCVQHANRCGPVGGRYGNPAVGWAVIVPRPGRPAEQCVVSPVLKSLRDAKRWAEERYAISGWRASSGSPYRQTYAIADLAALLR